MNEILMACSGNYHNPMKSVKRWTAHSALSQKAEENRSAYLL